MGIILYKAFDVLVDVISFLIIIRIILSWLPFGRENSIINAIFNLTEPLLAPIRKIIEKSPIGRGMMIDFSPIILFLLLNVIQRVILELIL